jgi:hypothetical protein
MLEFIGTKNYGVISVFIVGGGGCGVGDHRPGPLDGNAEGR